MKTRAQQIREAILKDNPGVKPKIVEDMTKRMGRTFGTLNKKKCEVCGRSSDTVIPVVMKICRRCGTKIGRRVGHLKIIKTEYDLKGYHCDWCGTRVTKYAIINPEICDNCIKRFGMSQKAMED